MEKGTVPEVTPEMVVEARQHLKTYEGDRQALIALVDPLFVAIWTEILSAAQAALPHTRGDNSPNARLFNTIRSRALDVGNAQRRLLPKILDDFAVSQVFVRQVEERMIKTPVRLPSSVKQASEMSR